MVITQGASDQAILAEIGSRIEGARLRGNMRQSDLAERAGIGLVTLRRLEAGKGVTLANLVRVLRALGAVEGLEDLLPAPGPSPMEELRLAGRRRRRASGPREEEAPAAGSGPAEWTWGDE